MSCLKVATVETGSTVARENYTPNGKSAPEFSENYPVTCDVGCVSSGIPNQTFQFVGLLLELFRVGLRQAPEIFEFPSDAGKIKGPSLMDKGARLKLRAR